MTVRVERLETTSPSPLALATIRILSAAAAAVSRWWHTPTALIMSDNWMSDHARSTWHRDPH